MKNGETERRKIKSRVLLLTDLDGTLLNSSSRVSPENARMIRLFQEAGGLFGIATGRSWEDAQRILGQVHPNAPCILCNGSLLYDPVKQVMLETYTLEEETVKRMTDLAKTRFPHINIIAYTEREAAIVSDPDYLDAHFIESHQPCRPGKINEILNQCVKLFCFGTQNDFAAWRAEAKKQGVDAEWVLSGPDYLEILPPGRNKGTMLPCLREHLRRAGEEGVKIFAMGDFYNDVELLSGADVGIAPENAVKEAKQAADFVTVSNEADAVAAVLRQILFEYSEASSFCGDLSEAHTLDNCRG